MKKLLLKFPVAAFVLAFLLLYTCQRDEVSDGHSSRQAPDGPAFRTSRVYSDGLYGNTSLSESVATLQDALAKNGRTGQNKEVYSAALDFTIETDYATYIESANGTYHSYTFPVYRATDGFPLENLLLSLRPDGSYRAFLVEYALTGEETEALFGGAPVDLDGKVSFVPIDAGALVADVFSKVTTCGVYTYYDCWETACDMVINGEVCGCWDPMYTGTECGSLVGYNDNCGDVGTGTNTGNEGGTGGSTGTGGHGGTGIPNPDITSPTQGEEPWRKILECNSELLQIEGAVTWLQSHKHQAGQISNYLQDNCNAQSWEFALQGIQAEIEGGETDWVLQNINRLTNPCAKEIFNELENGIYTQDILHPE